jgi:hypothetical protein
MRLYVDVCAERMRKVEENLSRYRWPPTLKPERSEEEFRSSVLWIDISSSITFLAIKMMNLGQGSGPWVMTWGFS